MSPKQNIHKENQTWAALWAEVGWDKGAEGRGSVPVLQGQARGQA